MTDHSACAPCWYRKRPCKRTGAAQCVYCTRYLNTNQHSVISSITFPEEEIRQTLFPHGLNPNLDAEDSESFVLCVTTANNHLPISSSTFTGPGNIQNASLMDPLNRGIHAEFAAPLRVQDAALEIMGKARSAGAWLHMFYRVRIIEQVQVLLNGEAVDTVEQLWVESGFRALALSRIGELICTTMTAIRIAQGAEERESAHAAAVILRHEILTFMAALPLNPNLVPVATQQRLLRWLKAVTDELQTLICQACGEIPSWSSVILDPLKDFRVFRQHGQPVVITLTLSRNKRSIIQIDQPMMSPSETGSSPEVESPATTMNNEMFSSQNQFGWESFLPHEGSPPSPTGSIHPNLFASAIKDPDQVCSIPNSPPPTTIFNDLPASCWEMLSDGCINPSWLSIQSNFIPIPYPDERNQGPVSPTYDVEVNMEHSRSYSSFSNHLAIGHEVEMDLDPAQYPPVVSEDDADLYEFIDFHDESTS